MKKTALFRAGCSETKGTGHLRRSITLGDELKARGFEVLILVDDNSLARKIANGSSGRFEFIKADALFPAKWANELKRLDILIIDVPQSDQFLINSPVALRMLSEIDHQGIPVVSMGHLAHLTYSFRAVIDLYPSREVHAANYFEGPDYLILRPDFYDIETPTPAVQRSGIVISMGGADPHDLTRRSLEALLLAGITESITVVVGLGYGEDREQRLHELVKSYGSSTVQIKTECSDFCELLKRSRLGLVCFGTTAYELMCLGTPCFTFSHYKWQEPSALLFQELEACLYLGCAEDELDVGVLSKTLKDAGKNFDLMQKLADKGREIVDGKGAKRVASLLEGFVSEKDNGCLDCLYILAHPGDEIFATGATILKQQAQGKKVGVVILGEGQMSRVKESEDRASTVQSRRSMKTALMNSMETMDIQTWYYFQFQDNRFDRHDLLDLVKVIESIIRRHQPRAVYTHHPGDLNIDHRKTFEAVMTAVRPLPGSTVETVYSIEVPSSSDWGAQADLRFLPNWFEEIEPYLVQKLALARLYPSELCEDPHPRSLEGLEDRARHWGRICGCAAAEAFVLHRHIQKLPSESETLADPS